MFGKRCLKAKNGEVVEYPGGPLGRCFLVSRPKREGQLSPAKLHPHAVTGRTAPTKDPRQPEARVRLGVTYDFSTTFLVLPCCRMPASVLVSLAVHACIYKVRQSKRKQIGLNGATLENVTSQRFVIDRSRVRIPSLA